MPQDPLLKYEENTSLLVEDIDYEKLDGGELPKYLGSSHSHSALTRIHTYITSISHAISLAGILKCLLHFLTPTFLRKGQSPDSSKPQSSRKKSTHSHLDGLRGLAALFVFFFHSSYTVWNVRPGYASTPEYTSLLRLPFFKLLFAGDAMVSIFFVVSGFVLSIKPARLMSAGSYDTLFDSISSAGFRRGIRLYFPPIVSTLMIMIVIRLGIYESTREFAEDKNLLRGSGEFHMIRFDSFWEQLWHWSKQCFNFFHVWDWENIYAGNTAYDVHLWTIPAEYRCSMLLFLTQIVIARASARVRLGSLIVLVMFAASWGRWEMMDFWAGAILAELDNVAQLSIPTSTEPTPGLNQQQVWKTLSKKTAWFISFFVGLYLLSFPDQYPKKTIGYETLWSLVPASFSQSNRFWQAIGAFVTALSINNHEILQKWFTTPAVKYLGNLSFSLYLVHGLVIHTVGYTLLPFIWSITGRTSDFQIGLGWLISQSIVTVVAIYAADLFWVNVDLPSNRLCHWLEGLFFNKRK